MTKGEKETLISEVQCAAGFFVKLQKSASVYTMNDVARIDEAFAKYLMYAIRDWIEKTYGDHKDILNELVRWLIDKEAVALFWELPRGSGKND